MKGVLLWRVYYCGLSRTPEASDTHLIRVLINCIPSIYISSGNLEELKEGLPEGGCLLIETVAARGVLGRFLVV